jgi:hypothetical protein
VIVLSGGGRIENCWKLLLEVQQSDNQLVKSTTISEKNRHHLNRRLKSSPSFRLVSTSTKLQTALAKLVEGWCVFRK